MNILIVTDCHGKLMRRMLNDKTGLAECLVDEMPNIALFLGDNYEDDIGCITDWLSENKCDIPMFGVFGNHDAPYLIEKHGITNIHMKTVDTYGYKIGGFGGAIKYKDEGIYKLFTNEESAKMLSELEACDILITHSNPQFRKYNSVNVTPKASNIIEKIKYFFSPPEIIYEKTEKPLLEDCHAGLVGIGDYIEKNSPRMCIHGHIHERKKETHNATVIKSCYGVEIISV